MIFHSPPPTSKALTLRLQVNNGYAGIGCNVANTMTTYGNIAGMSNTKVTLRPGESFNISALDILVLNTDSPVHVTGTNESFDVKSLFVADFTMTNVVITNNHATESATLTINYGVFDQPTPALEPEPEEGDGEDTTP